MTQYSVNLSSAQDKALSSVATVQQEWITAVVHERCRIAIEEIVQVCIAKCLETNAQIPGSKDAMVELAFEQGWVKTAAQRQAEFEAAAAAAAGQNETNTNV